MKTFKTTVTILLLVLISGTKLNANNTTNQKGDDMKDNIVGGMEYVIIQHEVKDFAAWKELFDADEAVQREAGLRLMYLLQASDNPNKLTVIFEYSEREKSEAFFANPELAERMQNAGVISKPDFTFFKTECSGIPTHNAFLMVKHKVADYEVWKKGFDEDEDTRKEYKLSLVALGKNVHEEGYVVVLINANDTESILSFMQNSGLKEKMEKVGVISEPAIDIMSLSK